MENQSLLAIEAFSCDECESTYPSWPLSLSLFVSNATHRRQLCLAAQMLVRARLAETAHKWHWNENESKTLLLFCLAAVRGLCAILLVRHIAKSDNKIIMMNSAAHSHSHGQTGAHAQFDWCPDAEHGRQCNRREALTRANMVKKDTRPIEHCCEPALGC